MRILAIGVLVFVVAGCGFVFVEGPPPIISEDAISVRCTESRLLPTLDVVWAGFNAATAILIASDSDRGYRAFNFTYRAAWSILSGFSAKSGYETVNRCREAKDMIEVRNR